MQASKPRKAGSAYYRHRRDEQRFQEIDQIITKYIARFHKPGVLTVRPGYKSVGGWPTRKPAIVVTVAEKRDRPPEETLPTKLNGIAVDVRQATALEKLRVHDAQRYKELVARRPEMARPEFLNERDPASGQTIIEPAEEPLLLARGATQLPYMPPDGFPLKEVQDAMALVCHASPDAGWPQLKNFLLQVRSSLTVGMYDFTSEHILQFVEDAFGDRNVNVTLTLDHPAKNPGADQTDEETVAELQQSLGRRFEEAWALVRSSPKAPEWIFPTAYHIKVAVGDSVTFWLSSGNWNNSNQPDIDPLSDPEGSKKIAKQSDRDWHIVVEHEGLAKTYKAYLEQDFSVADQAERDAPQDMAEPAAEADEFSDILKSLDTEALSVPARVPLTYFAPKRIPSTGTRNIRLQPILTPDNYVEHVLPLINSAERSFYMQTQYIHPSKRPEDQQFIDLIDAVVLLQRNGIDVRIILRDFEARNGGLEALQAIGIDLSGVRIQHGVHNKGMIVDSQTVMLGSQNWSGDGVLRNRDASLIIFDAEAAAYYEQIFLHDWNHMAAQPPAS